MTKTPLITVAIPTFNSVKTLENCIESVLNQTTLLADSDNIEIVICDNCSTDATSTLCSDYVQRYGGLIRYYRNAVNCGYDENINILFKRSSGQFVKILCDDDALCEGALIAHMKAIRLHPEIDLILSNFDVFDSRMEEIIHQMPLCGGCDELFLEPCAFFGAAMGSYGQTSSLLIRRDAWNRIPCEPSFGSKHIQVYMVLRLLQIGSAIILAQPWIKVRTGSPNFLSSPTDNFMIPLEALKIYSDFSLLHPDKIYRDMTTQQRDYIVANMRQIHNTNGLSAEHIDLHNILSEKQY